jgi:dCMP deaminase
MNKWNEAHMKVAEVYAELSSAKRLKVGCVIVKDNRIISIGYNGMPSGWDNICEHLDYLDGKLTTKREVLHAETNAIAKLAQSTESGKDAELYVTVSPCIECAKLIHQVGISKVFYRQQYRNCSGLDFLSKCDIIVHQI